MSANLIVDLANTADTQVSVALGSGASLTVGATVDLLGANTYCNVFCNATAGSGPIQLQVQTSDSTTSGSFADPTSGLVAGQFPVNIVSGGNFWVNSGLWSSGYSSPAPPVDQAPLFCSGGNFFGAFQRPQRYARLINVSGAFPSWFVAGFVSQKKNTGSGGGFSYSPGSGSVNV